MKKADKKRKDRPKVSPYTDRADPGQNPAQDSVIKSIRSKDQTSPTLTAFIVLEIVKWGSIALLVYIFIRFTQPVWMAIYRGILWVIELF